MTRDELLDKLVGTGVPYESIVSNPSLTTFELCQLNRLERQFDFKPGEFEGVETVKALYRFKETLRYYSKELWAGQRDKLLRPGTEEEARRIFLPISLFIDDRSRRCFSHNQFFGKIHYLLHACSKYGLPRRERRAYLKMLYDFPVIPSLEFREVVEHEIFPANLPHVFMDMAAGLIRAELERGRSHKKILGIYKTFLRERHINLAHARWFNTRLPGSAGSRQ